MATVLRHATHAPTGTEEKVKNNDRLQRYSHNETPDLFVSRVGLSAFAVLELVSPHLTCRYLVAKLGPPNL